MTIYVIEKECVGPRRCRTPEKGVTHFLCMKANTNDASTYNDMDAEFACGPIQSHSHATLVVNLIIMDTIGAGNVHR